MTTPAPVPRPVPPDEGEARCTIAEWMERGPALARGGVSSVVIADRHPDADRDRLSPEGAFFWHYGRRWLADDMDCSACTLPEAVFIELPDCPYPEVVAERDAGRGIAPRWPTPDGAIEALSLAAMRWAIKQAEAPPMTTPTDPPQSPRPDAATAAGEGRSKPPVFALWNPWACGWLTDAQHVVYAFGSAAAADEFQDGEKNEVVELVPVAAGRPGPETAAEMTLARAVEVLNERRHHGHGGWYVPGPDPATDPVVYGEDRYEVFGPFEAIAIAEKYEGASAADAARAAIVGAIGREVERMRRKVEPPPGGGCYLREDDDLGRLDAYEHALSLAESAGAGQATEGDARGD